MSGQFQHFQNKITSELTVLTFGHRREFLLLIGSSRKGTEYAGSFSVSDTKPEQNLPSSHSGIAQTIHFPACLAAGNARANELNRQSLSVFYKTNSHRNLPCLQWGIGGNIILPFIRSLREETGYPDS